MHWSFNLDANYTVIDVQSTAGEEDWTKIEWF